MTDPAEDWGAAGAGLRELQSMLDEVVSAVIRTHEANPEPSPDSVLAAEAANSEVGPGGTWGEQPALHALALGQVCAHACVNHIGALQRLLEPPMSLFAWEVIIRAALEAAAQGWWLLDPHLTLHERVVRAMTERLYSIKETTKAYNDIGVASPDLAAAAADLEREAAALGVGVVRSRKGDLLYVGTARRLKITELVGEFLADVGLQHGTSVYRHLCGVAHATAHAIWSSYGDAPDAPSGSYRLVPELRLNNVSVVVLVVGVACLNVESRLAEYCGWDRAQLNRAREQLGDEHEQWWRRFDPEGKALPQPPV